MFILGFFTSAYRKSSVRYLCLRLVEFGDPTYSLHCGSFLGLLYRNLQQNLVNPKATTMETIGKLRLVLIRGLSICQPLGQALLHCFFTVSGLTVQIQYD